VSAFPNATPFMKTRSFQCGFFLPGETGMHGLCCGEEAREGRMFCDQHHAETHFPLKTGRDAYNPREVDDNWHRQPDREPDLTELLS
jgi:hypothetical protein